MRYIRKDSRVYDFSLCKRCGAAGGCDHNGCSESTCLACGTTQCSSNGLGHGACSICFVGYLPEWSHSSERMCRYKGCGKEAIARDGMWPVCAAHLEQRRPGHVTKCLAERDKGWVLVD